MTKQLTYWSGILGVVFFVGSTIVGGALLNDYSHISQFISESYAIDTPYGKLLRYSGYLPSGFLLMVFAFSSSKYFKQSRVARIGLLGFGIFYGVATMVVSIFPCDAGCNKEFIDPSIAQIIHNLTGMLTYIFVPMSLVLISLGLRKEFKKLSTISIAVFLSCIVFISILIANPATHYTGLFQRIIEGSILLWVIICAHEIKSLEIVKSETT